MTNNKILNSEIKLQRENGLVSKINEKGILDYNFLRPALNFRISEVLAALGLSQLSKLDQFIIERNNIADI